MKIQVRAVGGPTLVLVAGLYRKDDVRTELMHQTKFWTLVTATQWTFVCPFHSDLVPKM